MAALYIVSVYVGVGAMIALAFALYGPGRALSEPREATLGARILLIPGAILLWPYIAYRLIRPRAAI